LRRSVETRIDSGSAVRGVDAYAAGVRLFDRVTPTVVDDANAPVERLRDRLASAAARERRDTTAHGEERGTGKTRDGLPARCGGSANVVG
jgi:hypothetical protein